MKKNNYFFRDYKTKTALKKDIKDLIDSYAFNQEFESELLSDLIAQKHYYCSYYGIKPLRFIKRNNYNSYDFYGFFTTLGWHKVSWRKCIYPESKELIVKQALRDAIQPYSSECKRHYPICERCCKEPSEETDHIDPEFDVIAKQALETLSDKDWESIMINSFDFSIKEPFRLPENNPALIYTLEAHKTAKLQAVCKKCHNANAKERRKKT